MIIDIFRRRYLEEECPLHQGIIKRIPKQTGGYNNIRSYQV